MLVSEITSSVEKLISKNNRSAGVFLCRGRIDELRTQKRRSLPPSHPHYLNDEGYKRHLSSRSHPDENDIAKAVWFLRDRLTKAMGHGDGSGT